MKYYDLSDIRVLVVDDNRFMRNILHHMLKTLGAGKIEHARDGGEALALLAEADYELVLSDWEMERMNGCEFVRTLRGDRGARNRLVPIIMVTANGMIHTVLEARDSGVTEFLVKPFSVDALYRRILMVIESPRQFVKTKDYFGPDRRRRNDPEYKGPFRRASDEKSRASG